MDKLSVKLMPPNEKYLSQMDVIFDLIGSTAYLPYIKPTSVYIYIVPPHISIKNNNTGAIIWSDFNLLWQRHETTADVIEAILMSEGYTKGMLRTTIDRFDIQIHQIK